MLNVPTLLLGAAFVLASYVIYQRHFHPLSSFPGPYLASITNFWRFYHELRGDLPVVIDRYHAQCGPFVRVAPDEINTNVADVVDVVYIKGGRHYLKSKFYDGFTTIRPNIFGTRDEDIHAIRRRQMAHAFSQASLVKMEYVFNRHTVVLLEKLQKRATSGSRFSMRDAAKFFSHDANGDLSLGIQFGTQQQDDPTRLPRLNDHIALAKLTGYVPWIRKWFNRYGPSMPWKYLQQTLQSRTKLRADAVIYTDMELERVGRNDGSTIKIRAEVDEEPDHINLLTCRTVLPQISAQLHNTADMCTVTRAKDPETGELLDRDDISSNALAFLVAGSHSTAATIEICFWYLCRYPNVQRQVQAEIDDAFDRPKSCQDVLPFSGLQAALPYTSAVVKECFRISPTFQHPAPRITPPESNSKFPTLIADTVIPPGHAISMSILSLHTDEDLWGKNAKEFVPERWLEQETREKERYLMHFGAGHRACIGRNQASIMIWKALTETLRRFSISFADEEESQSKCANLRVRGFAELARPLRVKLSDRMK